MCVANIGFSSFRCSRHSSSRIVINPLPISFSITQYEAPLLMHCGAFMITSTLTGSSTYTNSRLPSHSFEGEPCRP